jgi:hypothetical protein
MALKLKFTICENNCKYLTLTDETGIYNGTTNTGGFGTPNVDIGDATSATITITDPDETETIIDLFALSFPSDSDNSTYIVNTQLGFASTDKLTDGIWTFLYTVIADSVTYTKTIKKLIICNAKCSIDALRLQILNNCNKQEKTELYERISELDNLVAAAQYATECNSITQAETIVESINDLLENNDCNCN